MTTTTPDLAAAITRDDQLSTTEAASLVGARFDRGCTEAERAFARRTAAKRADARRNPRPS